MARSAGKLQAMPTRGSVRFNSRPRNGKPMIKAGYPAFTGRFSRGPAAKVVAGRQGAISSGGRFGRNAGRVSGSFITVKPSGGNYRYSRRSGGSIQADSAAARRLTG